MKKQLLAMLMVVAMLCGMIVPVSAVEVSTEYAMEANLAARADFTASASNLEKAGIQKSGGYTMDISMKAKDVISNQTFRLTFAVDTNVLRFVSSNGCVSTSGPNGLLALASPSDPAFLVGSWSTDKTNGAYTFSPVVGYEIDEANHTEYVTVKLTAGSTYDDTFWASARDGYEGASMPIIRDELADIVQINFGLATGATADQVTAQTIRLVSQDDLVALQKGFAGACVMSVSASEVYTYNTVNISGGVSSKPSSNIDNMAEPQILLNGQPLPAGPAPDLTGYTVSLSKKAVNSPLAGKTDTITATAEPDPSGANMQDADWDISPKDQGATIAANGTITIAAGCDGGTYTVTATSKTDSNITGSETFTVTKATAEATTMTVSATDKTAVYGTAKDITPTFAVTDQYGDKVNSPTITMDAAAGFSFDGTKVTVANTATVGKHTLTFKCGAASATLEITVGKANGPAAPSITPEDAATKGGNGKLKGTSTAMEYNTSATATTGWKTCSDTETLVPAGTYYVRVAETATHKAGDVTTGLVVNQPGTSTQPVVTITGGGEIAEGTSATLTATVTNAAACTGTLAYKWYKNDEEISGQTTNELTVSEAGTYKVEVTHTLGANDPAKGTATATVEVKGKTNVVVAKKATASQYEGALDVQNLVTVTDGTWNQVKDAVTPTVYKYFAAVADDPETTEDETADARYEEVIGNLTEGTYYVDVAVAAIADKDDYKVDEVEGKGAPSADTAPADLEGYVVLTVNKQPSGGGGVSGITVRYNVGEHGTLTGSATESVQRGKTPSKVPTVTAKDGYKFLGWSLDGTTVVDPTTVTITSSTTFTALYSSVKNTYISGYPDGTFRPDAHVTRAEVASMLARLNKDFDSNKTYTGSANDVAANTWFANFVNFGMEKGIISGYTDGTFRPDADITRGEFASMMARYMGLSGTGNATFADTNGHWAADSIAVLADKGIVNGYPDGGFHPDAQLTRAEAVQMINTALAVQALTGAAEVTPSDVASTHWAYTQIIAAMNTDIKNIIG